MTPLTDSDRLDAAGLEQLLEHVLADGLSGWFIFGAIREGPRLSQRLRKELTAEAILIGAQV